MKIDVITPEKTIYSGDIEMVKLPGTKGPFQILKNHAPIITTLSKGRVIIRDNKGEILRYDVKRGHAKCLGNVVHVLIQE